MAFNLSERNARRLDVPQTYWRPSKAAVHAMLHLAGFEVLATRTVHGRLTVLAQAKRPDDIEGRDPWVARAQRYRDRHYKEAADFDALTSDDGIPSTVRYLGPRNEAVIHRATFEADVPYQPRWSPSSKWAWFRDLAVSARMHASLRAAETRISAEVRARALARSLASAARRA